MTVIPLLAPFRQAANRGNASNPHGVDVLLVRQDCRRDRQVQQQLGQHCHPHLADLGLVLPQPVNAVHTDEHNGVAELSAALVADLVRREQGSEQEERAFPQRRDGSGLRGVLQA